MYKHKLNHLQSTFPKEAIENSEKFRDYCFEKIQERMDDLKKSGDDGLYMYFFDSSTADSKKLFWEPCIPTQYEIRQFSTSA
ncbi:hypothetical protein MHF_1300 [Mycoplasma haemofelis Ohio2]|uniref:Uncharacterized protein n=1 Tax=Mycoplasma haemofelis (strain Ohio2) TaxID=859194 RepID=F6FG38_MYCHI|nr:hypothetical protein MHF_1300 [Mycoplasma haemofelis Ohio2]